MYSARQPARSRFETEPRDNQKQIDNLVAIGLLGEPRSNVKKKRNVEFSESTPPLRQPITAAFVCLPS